MLSENTTNSPHQSVKSQSTHYGGLLSNITNIHIVNPQMLLNDNVFVFFHNVGAVL